MAEGYVKLYRKILDWEWYKKTNTRLIFLHLLICANWEDSFFRGVPIKRGQLVTTVEELATINCLTIQQTKTALKHLQITNEITIKSTPKFSIITLNNFNLYQSANNQNNSQTTANQQEKQPTKNKQNNSLSLYNKESKNKRSQENAHIRTRGGVDKTAFEVSFERFWSAYPKKTAKQQAFKAWEKLKPDEELLNKILKSLEQQKRTVQWSKDGGQYIPYPATWLNGRRWEDDLTCSTGEGLSESTARSWSDYTPEELEEQAARFYD